MKKALETANDIIYVIDKKKRLTYINQKIEQYGYKRKDLIGKEFLTIFSKKHRGQRSGKTLRKGGGRAYEVDFLDTSGKVYHGVLSTSPHKNENEKIVGLLGILTDITEQKNAQEEFRSSERRFKTLFEDSLDAIFIADIETGKILDVNKQAEELMGYSRNRLIGMYQTDLHPKVEKDKYKEIFREHGKKGKAFSQNLVVEHKNGKEISVNVKAQVLEIGGEKIIQGIFRDITQEKRAEERIRFLGSVAEQVHDSVLVTDLSGKIKYVNKATERLFGFTHRELYDKNPILFYAEKDAQGIQKDILETLSTGRTWRGEYLNRRKDKNTFVCEMSISPIKDAQGNAVAYVGVQRDITLRKQVESELRHNTKILNSTSEAIIGADNNGKINIWNNAAECMFGYKKKEIIGKKIKPLMPSERHFLESRRMIKKVKSEGSGLRYETQRRCKDGRVLEVSISITRLKDDKGDIIGTAGILTDITNRKLAEQELINLKEFNENIVEKSPIGIHVVDKEYNVLSWNSYLEKYSGLKKERIIGKNLFKVIPGLAKQGIHKDYNNVLKTGISFEQKAHRRIKSTGRDKGEVVYQSRNIVPLYQKGEITGAITLLEDVTDRKLAEEALKISEEKWRLLVQNLPDIIMTVSRDGTILSINRTIADIPMKEAIGRKIYDYTPPSEHEKMRRSLNRAFRTGNLDSHEILGVGPDGTESSWYHARVVPIKKDDKFTTATIISTDITERKRMEERLVRFNKCVLSFGSDSKKNINSLVALCGELMRADCALYNRIERGQLYSLGRWNIPPGFCPEDKPKGHICYDVIKKAKDENILIKNLQKTRYSKTDPTIKKYKLQTYMGRAVKHGTRGIGALCTAYKKDFSPNREDEWLLEVIASEIAVEEGRMQTQRELRESEKKYKNLVEKAGVAISVDDRAGKLTFTNKTLADLFGYDPKEMGDKNHKDLVHPDDYARTSGFHKQRMAGKKAPLRYDFRGVRKDGSIRHLEVVIGGILQDGKKVIGTRSYLWDITDRKQAEQEIRDSAKKYSTLVEKGHDGIIIIYKEEIRFSNKKFADLLGYDDKEQLIGLNLSDVLTAQSREFTINRYKKRINGKVVPRVYETTLKKKTGEPLIVEVSAGMIPYEEGKADLVFVRDITDRKKVEEALRESEAKYRSIVDNSLVGIFIHQDYKIKYVNAEGARLMGYKPSEFVGKGILDILPEHEKKRVKKIAEARYRGENPPERYELVALKKSGVKINLLIHNNRITYQGRPAIQVAMIDITDRKRAEELCMLQIEELRKIDRMKDEFLAVSSHELKTPLIPIEGYLELLVSGRFGILTKRQIEIIEKVRRKETHLKSLIRDLLDFNRLQTGRVSLEITEFDLVEVINEAITEQSFDARQKGINIRYAGECNLPKIKADHLKINQVLTNILQNAIKFSPQKSDITIKAKRQKDDIVVSISDEGVGITKQELKKIFDIFYQVDSSASRRFGGAGLGLAICRKIIEYHGGRIWAESEPFKGSTFYFTLTT
ncbi:MAG: PAS domain S-box protein [Candidatus Altiarchaeota archaeon]